MTAPQFTVLIRLPFVRGSFVDPPQAQWDAEKDRQLWKVISKTSKTSDLNWVELAIKFRVPPTFLLQQAAWLYERHLQHVRDQMKKVTVPAAVAAASPSGSNFNPLSGVAMQRTGSGGSEAPRTPRTVPALPVQQWDSPNIRGGDTITAGPLLSRTPSTTTLTQSRAYAQQVPKRIPSTLSAQRSNSRRSEDQTSMAPSDPHDSVNSPSVLDSSSSGSSSLSDTNHPAHRSQLFKRPPRFRQQRPQDLATFEEGDGTQEAEHSGSHGHLPLPFASAARRQNEREAYTQDMPFRASTRREQKAPQTDGASNPTPTRHLQQDDQQSQASTETASSITSFADDAAKLAPISPMSPPANHRAELARLGSPRAMGLRKEGSEGTPSMGSSFSDIDDAGISQSALEEALLSNMQHGKMSTFSRMSRYL
ncbi:hypothetical protein P153DRAFT_364388 [Dothidotthia symphoricarpi CBS 119687]|uniref:Autophagy-related protein 29 n=1 Tax=Dothidotthia symphoricarpi CBS 119687 TaxID=1392245 RepID=A0A6A6ALU9_9PLEO|nr:uncharacterized protein P153DRAFT_364388 [Dothidotthia symphoricarpi CBS 119687]KAF2131914.1 hypothetical protein P153DRAFT_364388 [Dothidotthia symphoricarpi CBS 119687]